MFRKREKFNRPLMFFSPEDVSEEVIKVDDMLVRGVRKMSVSIVKERYSDRSKVQLSPKDFSLETLIKSGTVIEPGTLTSYFGLTDVSDIESRRNEFAPQVLEYLQAHESDIKEFLNNK